MMLKALNTLINVIADAFKSFFSTKRAIKSCAFVLVSIIAVVCSFFASGATLAYNVELGGEVIATVKSKSTVDGALNIVENKVNGKSVSKAVGTPKYTLTIVSNNSLSGKAAVADEVIEKSDSIVKASQLFINGNAMALAEENEINTVLEDYKSQFSVAGAECSTEFVENVELKNGYFLKTALDKAEKVQRIVATLTVKTVANIVTEVVTEYKSVTKNTSEQVRGYKEVTTAGKNGLNRVTEQVVAINGAEQQRTEISNEVVTKPIDEVVTVGTARNNASAQAAKVASSAGFAFPLPAGAWQVSAYYGDGRGHKGMDLRAPRGTAIYAVAAGTVTKSRYDGGYGYVVEVDHGNGITTAYAHASQLCVKVGDRVNAGDVIALVGSTGNSTGNHLHFEVKVGGNRVNPAPYIGL